ncbi:MAG: helix-turn-helix transcriptional regulator, partial [Solirubrobacteraceae bacterium]
LRRLGGTVTPAARALKLTLAMALALRGEETVEGVGALVSEGLDDGRFLADETSESISAAHAMSALIFVDELDRACGVADAVLADARRRGSALGLVSGMAHRGLAHLRAGRLAAAEADLTAARELVDERQMGFTLPFIRSYLATLLLELGRVEEAAAMVDEWGLDRESMMAASAMAFLQARAAVRVAQGRPAEAMADLSSSGEFCRAAAIRSPTALAWRSPLAMLIAPQDRDEAQRLVRIELAEARRAGVARGVGVALRTLGVLKGGSEGLDLLRQAVEVLARSPARLEQSRAYLELGAMLARGGRRIAAREPLRIAGDLAYRCRADALTAQVRREALAAGARPRRQALTGIDALTPGELRVVTLAGKGIANREIAQSLFLSVKTVKDHLGSSYRKLGVTSRTELGRALDDGASDMPPTPP